LTVGSRLGLLEGEVGITEGDREGVKVGKDVGEEDGAVGKLEGGDVGKKLILGMAVGR
jgi:hypothetical protein